MRVARLSDCQLPGMVGKVLPRIWQVRYPLLVICYSQESASLIQDETGG
jgi:hypothetical protein